MQYLLKDIRIYEGTNSRGKYHWMSATLFNDKNIRMNSERRVYYSVSEDEAMLYMPYATEDPNNKGTFLVNSNDVEEAMKPGGALARYGDVLHANVVKITWPLHKPYGRVYGANVIDEKSKEVKARKGEFIKSESGQIMEYRELSFYLATDIDTDTGERIYGDKPQDVANRILERYYRPLDSVDAPSAEAANTEEPLTEEEKKAKLEALKAELGL